MTPAPPSSRSPERTLKAERERIQRVYEEYNASDYHRQIWGEGPVSRLILDHKWERIGSILRSSRLSLGAARILDIGAGEGRDAARFRDLGAEARRILAFDLRQFSLRAGRNDQPWLSAVCGDACQLPFRSDSFDIAYQSTMISSILIPSVRRRILEEIGRVVAPGGFFLSYDTRYPNPANRNTMPLRLTELTEAFKGWSVRTWSITAIPQLQRLVGRISLGGCRALERIPILRSHLLVLIGKPA